MEFPDDKQTSFSETIAESQSGSLPKLSKKRRRVEKDSFEPVFSSNEGTSTGQDVSAEPTKIISRKKGKRRGAIPNAAAIEARGAYARKKIKALSGDGNTKITEIINLGNQGHTAAAIAAKFPIKENLIADILAQIAARPTQRKKPPRPKRKLKTLPSEERLIELYVKAVIPKRDILKTLNINDLTLYSALRHYGIPLRNAVFNRSSQAREQELKQMVFIDKLTPDQIAERLGISVHHTKKIINMLKKRITPES